MTDGRLDLLALRLAVAGDENRLRPNTGLEVRVIAGQLVEFALSGVVVDFEGGPAVVSNDPVPTGLEPTLDRVRELAGWRWDQLFWRQGIYGKAALEYATSELIDSEAWVRLSSARPFRPATYADTGGEALREVTARLNDVISGRAHGSARERILVALNALYFDRRRKADWMELDWVADLADLDDLAATQRVTVQAIIEAANTIAGLMRGGGSRDPVANGNY